MKFKYIKPTLVLFVICVVVSGLLALTYHFTYVPPITDPDEIVQLMSEDYLEVLPDSDDYKLINRTDGYDKLTKGEVVEIVSASNGYIITVHSSGQYDSDPIRVMVGISLEGTVTGLKLLKISETPGMGMKAQNQNWLNQFIGGKNFTLESVTETESTKIDGITAATKSSKAIVNAVNMALDCYHSYEQ